jgi:hypothetical protein
MASTTPWRELRAALDECSGGLDAEEGYDDETIDVLKDGARVSFRAVPTRSLISSAQSDPRFAPGETEVRRRAELSWRTTTTSRR